MQIIFPQNSQQFMSPPSLQNIEAEANYDFCQQQILNAVVMAKEQQGCRLLQKYLEQRDQSLITLIFDQIIVIYNEIITDQYGNYLCQKLAETCNSEQFLQILKKVKPEIARISINVHGTRAIQRIIEIIAENNPAIVPITSLQYMKPKPMNNEILITNYNSQDQLLQSEYAIFIDQIKEGLIQNFLILAKDINGNHVLLKCLKTLPDEDKEFIFSNAMKYCCEIAMDKNGCCTMQRCIDYGNLKQKEKLVQLIINKLPQLILDQYANYVIQHILETTQLQQYRQLIVDFLLKDFISLAKQKFPSNLIEKCMKLKIGSFEQSSVTIIINSQQIPQLINDQYANYVVQRCIQCATIEQKKIIFEEIQKNIEFIKNNEFGSKILNKIEKLFNNQLNQLDSKFQINSQKKSTQFANQKQQHNQQLSFINPQLFQQNQYTNFMLNNNCNNNYYNQNYQQQFYQYQQNYWPNYYENQFGYNYNQYPPSSFEQKFYNCQQINQRQSNENIPYQAQFNQQINSLELDNLIDNLQNFRIDNFQVNQSLPGNGY